MLVLSNIWDFDPVNFKINLLLYGIIVFILTNLSYSLFLAVKIYRGHSTIPVVIEGIPLEVIDEYIYLGSMYPLDPKGAGPDGVVSITRGRCPAVDLERLMDE